MEKLLEPLRDGPGDRDVLRVLSDALLEQGDVWGEAIQLALDLEDRFPGEDATIDGERRLRHLIGQWGPTWSQRLHGPRKLSWDSPAFFRAVPALRGSGVRDLTGFDGLTSSLDVPMGTALSKWPGVGALTQLRLVPWAAASSLDLGGAKRVTHLSVPWLGKPTIDALAGAPCLSRLEHLTVTSAQPMAMPLAELEALLALKVPRLRALELRNLELGLAGAQVLRDRLTWAPTRLTLDGAALGAKGLVALLGAKWLAGVKQLALRSDTPGPAGAEALVASPVMKQLVALDLTGTASAAKALVPFFAGVNAKALRALGLRSCVLKGKAAAPLAKAKLTGLRDLELSHAMLGDDGLAELAKSKTLTTLRVLGLENNAVKGPGLVALGKSAVLKPVEDLDLAHNKFQNAGAKGLAASKHVGALRRLRLGHNWLGVQGLKAILDNPALERLEELTEGTNNYAAQLERSFVSTPRLKLVRLRLGPDTRTDAAQLVFRSARTASLLWLEVACPSFDDAMAEELLAGPLAKARTQVHVQSAWARTLSPAVTARLQQALGARLILQ